MDLLSCFPRFFTSLLALLLGVSPVFAQRKEIPRATQIPRATRVEPAPTSPTYKLVVQDIIGITVFNEAELNTQARIDKDGAIDMPMVGLVRLAGQNIREASRTLETALREYLKNPQVTVTVLVYTKRKFSMLGQVAKPGIFEMPDEGTVNLLEALGMAGGTSRIASSKITVTRTVDGREQVIELDRKDMTKDGSIKRFQVLPGDSINVGERIF